MNPAAREPQPARIPESGVKIAIVLDGVPERWQMNVLQIRGHRTVAEVSIEGHGTIEAPAIRLTPNQARHLAAQITELLGSESAQSRRDPPSIR
ncbi:MAG: hypothetical protein JO307_32205 [Bryobacterales bacterium]|nr:hypothetical protein [Bryobacterales bacterium]MBV9398986.1 hypothetical protein [Bryobacterales bacterium]